MRIRDKQDFLFYRCLWMKGWRPAGQRHIFNAGQCLGDVDNLRSPRAPESRGHVRQTGSSRFCSAMRNFSFMLGFIDGSGLKRSL